MDGIFSCSCPVPRFSVSGVHPFGSVTRESIFNWLIILLFPKIVVCLLFEKCVK
jgi:hypothetical protein